MKQINSILPPDYIYSNIKVDGWHKHHIFEGRNRQNSEKYGLFIWLPPELHNLSNKGIHFDKEFDLRVKKIAQKAFEEKYPELDFLKIFRRNYL